jgi:hypothetical protein
MFCFRRAAFNWDSLYTTPCKNNIIFKSWRISGRNWREWKSRPCVNPLLYKFLSIAMCICGASVRERVMVEVVGGSNPAVKTFFSFEVKLFYISFLWTIKILEIFQFHFNCVRERKVKYSIFKLWIPPPLRMTQSAPLQIDHFKWQLSQVGYRTEKIQKGYSEKQICKCPPCNKQILIFAFQNFFECTSSLKIAAS